MKTVKGLLLILLSIVILLPEGGQVKADGAPPPKPGFGSIEPFHYESTEVRMVYERVEMELQRVPIPANESGLLADQVSVTAWFVMHNNGSVDEEMQVAFPLGDFNYCSTKVGNPYTSTDYEIKKDTFRVSVNGIPEETTTLTTKHPYSDEYGCSNEKMDWAGFEVKFPIDQDILIQVDYVMDSRGWGGDPLQAFQYILETGAGWKGTIGRANIIVHFPYMTSDENILSGTTPGYQYLYDEIYWSFQDLEPTRADNITVAFVHPSAWQDLQQARRNVETNIHDVDSWIKLAETYEKISCCNYRSVRNYVYRDKMHSAYRQLVALNPDSPVANAAYAYYLYYYQTDWSIPLTLEAAKPVLEYINKALALDPLNQKARELLGWIQDRLPDFTFTPPPAIPPTRTYTPSRTPLVTDTPASTPTITPTFVPSDTSILAATPQLSSTSTMTEIPLPTNTGILPETPTAPGTTIFLPNPSPTLENAETQPAGNSTPWLLAFTGVLFVAGGFIAGWTLRSKKV